VERSGVGYCRSGDSDEKRRVGGKNCWHQKPFPLQAAFKKPRGKNMWITRWVPVPGTGYDASNNTDTDTVADTDVACFCITHTVDPCYGTGTISGSSCKL
jgi:hypothetical protein